MLQPIPVTRPAEHLRRGPGSKWEVDLNLAAKSQLIRRLDAS